MHKSAPKSYVLLKMYLVIFYIKLMLFNECNKIFDITSIYNEKLQTNNYFRGQKTSAKMK